VRPGVRGRTAVQRFWVFDVRHRLLKFRCVGVRIGVTRLVRDSHRLRMEQALLAEPYLVRAPKQVVDLHR
jgi:hypothetical protein